MVAVAAGRLPALVGADARFVDRTLRKRAKGLFAKVRSHMVLEAKIATHLG